MTEIREGVKGWQEQVSAFIEEHRPLLEDPESGYSTLSRIYTQGAAVLTAVSDEGIRVASETTRAANLLTDAINDPHCSAGKVAKKEKAYKRLSRENDVMQNTFTELSNFLADVKARLDAEYEEGGTPKGESDLPQVNFDSAQDRAVGAETYHDRRLPASHPDLNPLPPDPDEAECHKPYREPPARKLPWWKRLLGIDTASQVMSKAARPFESSPGLQEPITPATPLESDCEDYQKLLDHYEELLVPLEDLFRTRVDHPVPYDIEPELLIRWQETRETLINKMAWCNRNMDAIERRNPHGISRELLDKRENIASRRGELGE